MRPVAALALLVSLASLADACPRIFRCGPPGPVVVYPYCPPPVYYSPPVEVVRVPEARPADPVKEDVAPDGWCHIRGRVVFDGDPIPKQKLIPKSGGAYTEDWVVNPANRGVKNVVVWLAPEPTAAEWDRLKERGPNRPRDFPNFKPDQVFPGLTRVGGRLLLHEGDVRAHVPHVQAVQAGSTIVIRNATTVPDNPKWESRYNGNGNPLVPPMRDQVIKNVKPERFPIWFTSSLYPWMKAYIWVFDHPYFAVTDDDGEFEIKLAPKGNLRLFIWQQQTGFRGGIDGRFGEAIQVPSGRLSLGDVKLKAAKE
jgi:hypothetical protein